MRQRVAVAGAGGARGEVNTRQGVALRSARKARRRAGVEGRSSRTPTTMASAPEPSPSSSAQSVSSRRAVSTRTRCSGASPRPARPGAWSRPNSRAALRGMQQSTDTPSAGTAGCMSRRHRRRSIKAKAAAPSPAWQPPAAESAGFTSWMPAHVRPSAPRRPSTASSPRLQSGGAEEPRASASLTGDGGTAAGAATIRRRAARRPAADVACPAAAVDPMSPRRS